MSLSRRDFLLGAAAAPAVPGSYDVVVYGGVPCGIAAAVAAAREGARVLLIEPTRHIGGLSTSGINTAESEHMLVWTIGGLALEFYKRLGDHYQTGKPEFYFESSVAEKVYLAMLGEAGVEVRYGMRVEEVQVSGRRIEMVVLPDGSRVPSAVFVDAGYEGDLMARSGVPYRFGRESRAEFNEEAAGVRFEPKAVKAATVDADGKLLPGISAWRHELKEGDAHSGVMNYNFRPTFAKDPVLQAAIPKPQRYDARRFALLENWIHSESAVGRPVALKQILAFYGRRNGKFEVNNIPDATISMGHFGGQFDYPDASYKRRDEIIADHWDYTLGLFHFLATHDGVPGALRAEMRGWGLHRGEFADNRNLPYQLYVREARRMKGAVVVTQRDTMVDRRKPDSIGIGSHFTDSHHVQRCAISKTEFVNEGRIWRTSMAYQIPYRAMTPMVEDCENLLVPGAASFTHVAFSSYRLESVWMIAGHAAGVAAAMAAKDGRRVQELDVAALQEKLRRQKQVVDFAAGEPERWSDIRKDTGGHPVL